jgi:hypothetical protein
MRAESQDYSVSPTFYARRFGSCSAALDEWRVLEVARRVGYASFDRGWKRLDLDRRDMLD